MHSLDWCRDVDYGSLPQWLTLVLAVILGYFSILGVRTATQSYKISRDAYVEDVRTKKFAQARLVYGEVVKVTDAKTSGTTYVVSTTDQDAELTQFLGTDGDTPIGVEIARMQGTFSVTPAAPVKIFVVSVHNDSIELISKVRATLRDGGTEIAGSVKSGRFIPPGKTVQKVLIVPAEMAPAAATVEVTFRDATGLFWRRDGAEPVAEVDPY